MAIFSVQKYHRRYGRTDRRTDGQDLLQRCVLHSRVSNTKNRFDRVFKVGFHHARFFTSSCLAVKLSFFLSFLVACTRLYKSLCRSVGWSVCRLVGLSVGRSVGLSVPLCFFCIFRLFTGREAHI